MKIPKTGADASVASVNSARTNGVDRTTIGKNKNAGEAKGILTNNDSAKVNVSERAQLMARAKELASKAAVDNSEKVARLQKMIDDGKYNVDASAVADRLVDTQMEFPE